MKGAYSKDVRIVERGSSADAFGRDRVSTPTTLFDSKQLWDSAPLFWDDSETSGASTTSTHSTDTASTVIGVANTTAGKRIRQTFQRFNYQPGKSQLILMTFVLDKSGGGTGIIREVGPMDDANGLFLRDNAGTIQLVRRTYVTGAAVDNAVNQEDWNVDTLDGEGPSRINIDFTKTQILVIDFEWLGVGRVRMGFDINGVVYYAHEFLNANNLDEVYISNPNLPLRYSIENDGTGAASTLQHLCSTVMSEGGYDRLGSIRYASTAGTHVDCATENIIYAIIGIKLKATHLNAIVNLIGAHMQEQAGNKQIEWIIKLNPTVAGTFTYADQTNSAVQVATGATANTVTGGVDINGGYFSSAVKGGEEEHQLRSAIRLGSAIDGTVDEMVLCARPVGGSSAIDIEGSMQWREAS
jgi:hypothetical protein